MTYEELVQKYLEKVHPIYLAYLKDGKFPHYEYESFRREIQPYWKELEAGLAILGIVKK